MSLTSDEIKEFEWLLDERDRRRARTNLVAFAKKVMPSIEFTEFHTTFYTVLDMFHQKKIKNLIISMPPQHGKTLGSSEMLPAFKFGTDPSTKMALISYSATRASKFNRDLQRRIDDDVYVDVFPDTMLEGKRVSSSDNGYLRNTEEFEIVEQGGYFKSVGVGGALTGIPVDMMIMDDLYKDYQDATSPTISEKVWDWYLTVARTRLHNESQQLIVFTRWDDKDLIGRLEGQGKVIEIDYNIPIEENMIDLKSDQFLKINFAALKVGQPTLLDKREEGEALWEKKHSREKLESLRELDADKFQALNQGNPLNVKGRMYGEFKTYRTPPSFSIVKSYCDTADTGKDYLCSIVYGIPEDSNDGKIYLIDVVYTQEAMEVTEPMVANQHISHRVREAMFESNNGGRGFARKIDEMTTDLTNVEWFHQSKNKHSRIVSNSASVTNSIIMPEGWHIKFKEFYDSITTYKKNAKNAHDDAEDALTGVYEIEQEEDDTATILW